MKILIVGAGIAGPTLAYWLRRFGHEPTVVERAPQLRDGGYLVDFWGAGFDVAERMGIVPELLDQGYRIRELREVDRAGARITHLDPSRLVDAAHGRYTSIARSDLAAVIYGALEGEVETIFDDTVTSLEDDGDRVHAVFENGAPREFDLVVGADGLHSQVRRLAFGPEAEFERRLGMAVGIFDVTGHRPRVELVALSRTDVGCQMLQVALRDDITLFFFTFRHDGDLPSTVEAQQELMRVRLGDLGGAAPAALEQMPAAQTFYSDLVSQIRMPSWSRGRVALVGDAAACPSLLAGQGSALAMVEAYVLAAELSRTADHEQAFAAYERQLAPMVRTKQDAAIRLAGAFAPRNRPQLFVRNAIMRLMGLPIVANRVMGRSLRDPITLPDEETRKGDAGPRPAPPS